MHVMLIKFKSFEFNKHFESKLNLESKSEANKRKASLEILIINFIETIDIESDSESESNSE